MADIMCPTLHCHSCVFLHKHRLILKVSISNLSLSSFCRCFQNTNLLKHLFISCKNCYKFWSNLVWNQLSNMRFRQCSTYLLLFRTYTEPLNDVTFLLASWLNDYIAIISEWFIFLKQSIYTWFTTVNLFIYHLLCTK